MRGLLISIPAWLVVALTLDLLGDIELSTTTFYAGGCLVMVLGLFLLGRDRPAGIVVRLPILYSSTILFSLSATLFVYSYFFANATVQFYIALTLLILGTCGVSFGLRRNPKA
jgi:hypothetical protein